MPRRYHDVSTAPPEVQQAFIRNLRPKPGFRDRLAGIPEWDGEVRYPSTGDNNPWSDREIHVAAWEALRRMASGQGWKGSKDDPNDPPAVTADIRARPFGPYGASPGRLEA